MYLITVNYNIRQLNGHLKVCLNEDSKIEDAKQIIVNELNKQIHKRFNEAEPLKANQIAVIFAGKSIFQ